MFKKENLILIILILVTFFLRVFRLDTPPNFYFDEVYHAFTAQAYAQNDPRGYEWWHTSEIKGTAYEWLHPPVAKLLMAGGILLFGNNSFGWRMASVIFGTLSVLLVYLMGKTLFNEKTGFTAAFLFSFDGLSLVQSRIAMNDIFVTFFILLTILMIIEADRRRSVKAGRGFRRIFWWSLVGISAGLAVATKWSGIFILPVVAGFMIYKKHFKKLWIFAFIPLIYLLSYSQFFLQGHSWQQFVELHKQTWWYETRLTATHPYQSKAWEWPILRRPVWYFVDYQKDKVAHIYALGNPAVWWGGLLSLPFAFWWIIKKKSWKLLFLMSFYFILWVPWIFSPRIMFIYHYLPALPFLCLILSSVLNKLSSKKLKNVKLLTETFEIDLQFAYLFICLFVYFYFYPHLTGLPVPLWLNKTYYWLTSWK